MNKNPIKRKIEKKILPEYFEKIKSRKKKFELRLNDFEIEEGDVLILREWNPNKKEYTGREIKKEVTDVSRFRVDELFWPKEEIEEKGIQIISLD